MGCSRRRDPTRADRRPGYGAPPPRAGRRRCLFRRAPRLSARATLSLCGRSFSASRCRSGRCPSVHLGRSRVAGREVGYGRGGYGRRQSELVEHPCVDVGVQLRVDLVVGPLVVQPVLERLRLEPVQVRGSICLDSSFSETRKKYICSGSSKFGTWRLSSPTSNPKIRSSYSLKTPLGAHPRSPPFLTISELSLENSRTMALKAALIWSGSMLLSGSRHTSAASDRSRPGGS